jgi:hypothetical protein
LLFLSIGKCNWPDHAAAESNIGKIRQSRIIGGTHQEAQVIGQGRFAMLCTVHGCGYASHREPDLGQGPPEQTVLLVAPSTATAFDDLVECGIYVCRQWNAQLDVEVFERDVAYMAFEDCCQRVERWSGVSGEAYAM